MHETGILAVRGTYGPAAREMRRLLLEAWAHNMVISLPSFCPGHSVQHFLFFFNFVSSLLVRVNLGLDWG